MVYLVGPNDHHRFVALDDVQVISIFNPPLNGDEAYDEDGSIEPTGEILPGPANMTVRTADEIEFGAGNENVLARPAETVNLILNEDKVGFCVTAMKLIGGRKVEQLVCRPKSVNYVLYGTGLVSNALTDRRHDIYPGTMFVAEPDERLSILAHTNMKLLTVSNPPE
jgi:hypothetical protein